MLVPSIFSDSLFDDFFFEPWFDDRSFSKADKKLYGHHGKNMMKTDIRETDKGYELEIDLPGFKKDEVQIALENGSLKVSASKNLDEDKKDEGKYIRRERYAGECERTFYVGENLKQEDIKASFKHGILKIDLMKPDEKQVEENKYIAIEG
jgi:HSP20 family molecular chaperone IbpA